MILAVSTFTLGMLLLLGAFHGVNPGMGWLFAVALGLQEQRRGAVWAALLPLALGHALAVAGTIVVAGLLGQVLSLDYLKWGVAVVLVGYGVYRLVRARHPSYGGMQVRARELTIWSFLMATAHGAGLMVLPFLFHSEAEPVLHGAGAEGHGMVLSHGITHATGLLAHLPDDVLTGLLITLVHTGSYFLVMGVIAVLVYEKLGLRLLRTAWLNLDLLWAGALILTGLLTVLL